jgi:hypothetical protein
VTVSLWLSAQSSSRSNLFIVFSKSSGSSLESKHLNTTFFSRDAYDMFFQGLTSLSFCLGMGAHIMAIPCVRHNTRALSFLFLKNSPFPHLYKGDKLL